MASIAMLIGGALVNALAFTSSSYLFSRLSKDRIDKERKRHNFAIEQLQKVQIECLHKRQKRIDFINKQLRLERKAETKFTELNEAMNSMTELAFIALSMVGIGWSFVVLGRLNCIRVCHNVILTF